MGAIAVRQSEPSLCPDPTQCPCGLSDHIAPNIRVLFVGINPGLRSALLGHHFAGYSNRFWKVLYASGLVPRPLTYRDDWRLPSFGLVSQIWSPDLRQASVSLPHGSTRTDEPGS